MPITKVKIDVTKIQKEHLFKGERGTYLDIAMFENRDGEDRYGNIGYCVQEISKEAREAGAKGPIIGNYKIVGQKSAPASRPATKPAAASAPASAPVAGDSPPDDSDPIPF